MCAMDGSVQSWIQLPKVPVAPVGNLIDVKVLYWDWHALLGLDPDAKQSYVIRGLLEKRAITLLYGAGGLGKSWLALDIALHVASGSREWLGFPIEDSGPVLYIDADNAGKPSEVSRRVRALTQDLSQERPFFVVTAEHLFGDGAQQAFEVMSRIMHRVTPKLVVVDTFQALYADDPNDAGKVTRFRSRLLQLAGEHDAALLVCDHVTKSDVRTNADDGLAYGSVYKMNFARIAIQMKQSEGEDDTFELILAKSNNIAPQEKWHSRTIVRRSDGNRVWHEVEVNAGASGEILEVLRSSNLPLTAKDIVERLEDQTSLRTVQRHLKALVSQGQVERFGGRGNATTYTIAKNPVSFCK